MRAADWASLTILVFGVPSLWFSQCRANSVRESEAVAWAVLLHFILRLLMGSPPKAARLAALLGICGARLDNGPLSTRFQKKPPPKDIFSSEALVKHKIESGTSSRHWRSVAHGY
jgi:hypothetical protein